MPSVSDFFWLYRPTAPSVRAQSIQVINAAWATAARGHQVTVAVQAPEGERVDAEAVLSFYGLRPIPSLNLRILPSANTPASVAFRALFGHWVWRTGGRGIAIARSKRYALEAIEWASGRFRLVVEAHEVDSAQLTERGQDASQVRALERRVLDAADAVICNAPGTLELLRETHSDLPPATALHNGTLASRARAPTNDGRGVGYVGSIRGEKDLDTVARAAAIRESSLTAIGPDRSARLEALSGGWMRFEPAIPHRDVPDRLARFRVLVLPVGKGLFGAKLTSPLKLWDYLASGVPIVAADTPAIRSVAADAFEPYPPGDAAELAAAISRVASDDAIRAELLRSAPLRTWDDRAAELDRFLACTIGRT